MSRKCVDCHNKYTQSMRYTTSLCTKCFEYRIMAYDCYKIVSSLGKYGHTVSVMASYKARGCEAYLDKSGEIVFL